METAASDWPSFPRGLGALRHWPAPWLPLATALLPALSLEFVVCSRLLSLSDHDSFLFLLQRCPAIMDRRSFKKKYATAHRFGSRKRKSPMAKKSRKKLLVSLSESERFVEAESSADDVNALPSTSSVASPVEEAPSTSTNRTVQCAAAVHESLSSVSATERKMQLTAKAQNPLVRSHPRNIWWSKSLH
ncbi:hypothetical protein HPB47_012805 [Ixodes persulcatus]|uniref:Uncharacterized protein n=1 Tax=Ixodes persulcatus TaxID=34615 RepID=A0AC60NSJ0_IXOPE|nr:hypothetical protein HPB47_012805 [Ixodes persulcatus]